jgi:hypothetical protein
MNDFPSQVFVSVLRLDLFSSETWRCNSVLQILSQITGLSRSTDQGCSAAFLGEFFLVMFLLELSFKVFLINGRKHIP